MSLRSSSVTENKSSPGRKVKLGKYTSSFPLLVKAIEKHGFDPPTFQPSANECVVWRFPPITLSEGGIMIPEDFRTPHVKGILVGWGQSAMDQLGSRGITLGHTVIFKRFAGWELNDTTPEHKRSGRILILNDRDISGSDDVMADLESGRARYIKGDDGRMRIETKSLAASKKEKILALAADPGATPAERKTAARLASKIKE